MQQGFLDDAERLLEHALSVNEKNLREDHAATASVLNSLGHLFWRADRPEEAEAHLKRSLANRKKCYGTVHEYTANSLYSLGSLYADMGRHAAAKPLLERAARLCENLFGPDDQRTQMARRTLADVSSHTGGEQRSRRTPADR